MFRGKYWNGNKRSVFESKDLIWWFKTTNWGEIVITHITITECCYDLVRKYVDLKQSQDNLCKSFDDRILELLVAEEQTSGFRLVLGIMKLYITDLQYVAEHHHLLLRDRTKDYLTLYCFDNDHRNFNTGLFNLIENAINKITIENLKREYEEITH